MILVIGTGFTWFDKLHFLLLDAVAIYIGVKGDSKTTIMNFKISNLGHASAQQRNGDFLEAKRRITLTSSSILLCD